MIRAYELPTEVARCDTSSFSVYHQIEEENEAKSLLRFGHSKNNRPDLRQYRQPITFHFNKKNINQISFLLNSQIKNGQPTNDCPSSGTLFDFITVKID